MLTPSTHPVVERLLAQITEATAGMTPADFERHPPGKWSPAGILEHLAITYEGTRRNFQKCLDLGNRRATRATLRQRLGVWVVVELGHFPTGVQAPQPTLPKGMTGEQALAAIRVSMPGMAEAMRECERRFGRRGAIADHPILGPLSVRQWRRFHWVHTRHHLAQIERLRTAGSHHP